MAYEPPLDDPTALSIECGCDDDDDTCEKDGTCAYTEPIEDRMLGDD